MITIGIDFAAQPRNTVIARIEWTPGAARVASITTPATDADVLAALPGAHAVGIDVPFGWPDAFTTFLSQHWEDAHHPVIAGQDAWRRDLSYRLTDRFVAERFGKWPLSVATDRIALPAMRAASLLAAIRDGGEAIDRSGGGRIAEVYPGLAVRLWELQAGSYKGAKAQGLAAAVDNLMQAAPWLDLGPWESQCRANDDVFDAVVAGLIARAHALGQWHRPEPAQLAQARREGWIVVPSCGLGALRGA